MPDDRALLPKLIVVGMLELLGPVRVSVLEVQIVGIPERPHVQIKLVTVGRAVVERQASGRRRRTSLAFWEAGVKAEVGGQHKRAVMKRIVAHVVIADRKSTRLNSSH